MTFSDVRPARGKIPFGGSVTPGAEREDWRQSPEMRAYSTAVLRRLEETSSWRKGNFFTRTWIEPSADGAGRWVDDVQSSLYGPSSLISASWIRTDHVAQSVPADVTWTSNVTIQPHELIASTTRSLENVADARAFTELDADGVPVMTTTSRLVDPIVVDALTNAIRRAEAVALWQGAASTTDPIKGLGSTAGIPTIAATSGGTVRDLYSAIWALVNSKRPPNASFVSPLFAQQLRQEVTSTGALIFPPDAPLVLDGVPIIADDGLVGAGYALVGNFKAAVVMHRVLRNGKLAMVRYSDQGAVFANYERVYSVAEAFDAQILPGDGVNHFRKLTGTL